MSSKQRLRLFSYSAALYCGDDIEPVRVTFVRAPNARKARRMAIEKMWDDRVSQTVCDSRYIVVRRAKGGRR